MNIDKDIEIVKEFIKKDYEPWSFYEKQGDELFELQEAIENVLSELEKKDKIIKTDEMMLKEDGIYIQELKSELETYRGKIIHLSDEEYNQVIENAQKDINKETETWKKIAEKLAYYTKDTKILIKDCVGWGCTKGIECTDCIIDWAKREVENNEPR